MKIKFINNKSKDKNEKLIFQLTEDLIDVVDVFTKINRNKEMTPSQEIYIILNSLHGFYHLIINKIYSGIKEESKNLFIKECYDLYNSYMNKFKEEHAINTREEQST